MAKKNKEKKNKRREQRAERKARARSKMENGGAVSRALLSVVTDYDYLIVLLVTFLTIFGVVMVFSAGYYSTVSLPNPDPFYFLKRQGMFAVIGFIIMFAMSRYDYHKLTKLAVPGLFIGAALLAIVAVAGVTVNGAKRWISLGFINITPSEICKLTLIVFTSVFLAKDPRRIRRFTTGVLPLLIIMVFHVVLIIKQPNLSTAIVIAAIMLGIMFVAGLNLGYFAAFFGALGAGILVILTSLHQTHWYRRLTNWVNPFADAQGDGYQVSQSLLALGNGGLKGLGLGNSITKNLYLPEPQNDFIMAIIGEELGFIGFFILMVLYLLLIWRCMTVATRANDKLGLYLSSGVAIMLGLQVIINVAVVTASMPATGITLPFVSYGGTSLWIFMAAMGIVLNISKDEKRREA